MPGLARVVLKENALDLSIIIPALNEGPNLEQLLPALTDTLHAMGITSEILIVDGNSPDNTRAIAARHGAICLLEDKPGYGNAVLRGIAEARGAFVLTMDADQSHPAEVVQPLWLARDKADITIASRYVPGGTADQNFGRMILSRVLNSFFRLGLGMPVKDMSSGFRLYRKAIFTHLDLEFTNFVLVVEVLLRAQAAGFTVQEVPFHYKPRASGASKARIVAFGKDYLRLFHRIRTLRNGRRHRD